LKKKEINSVICKKTTISEYALELQTGNEKSIAKKSLDMTVQHGLITEYKLGKIWKETTVKLF
jgi:hypothetical protein